VYFLCLYISLPVGVTESIAAMTVIALRLLAVKFHLHLPQLQPMNTHSKEGKE
jgi:uncharacterized membrane protein YeiH